MSNSILTGFKSIGSGLVTIGVTGAGIVSSFFFNAKIKKMSIILSFLNLILFIYFLFKCEFSINTSLIDQYFSLLILIFIIILVVLLFIRDWLKEIYLVLNLIILLVLIIILLNIKSEQTLIFDFNIVKINRKWDSNELELFLLKYITEKNIEVNSNIFNNILLLNRTPEDILVVLDQLKKELEVEQAVSVGHFDSFFNFVNKNMKILLVGGTIIIGLGLIYYTGMFSSYSTNIIVAEVSEVIPVPLDITVTVPTSQVEPLHDMVKVTITEALLKPLPIIIPQKIIETTVPSILPEFSVDVLEYCKIYSNISRGESLVERYNDKDFTLTSEDLHYMIKHCQIAKEISKFGVELSNLIIDAAKAGKTVPIDYNANYIINCVSNFKVRKLQYILNVILNLE